jgi:hypothetical protein
MTLTVDDAALLVRACAGAIPVVIRTEYGDEDAVAVSLTKDDTGRIVLRFSTVVPDILRGR